MPYPESYPETPPPWLDKMPTQAEVKGMYAPAIPGVAQNSLMTNDVTVTWDEERLRLKVGAHRLTRTLENGQLRTHCSCGYKDEHCLHEYVSYLVMKRICINEGWQYPGRPAPANAAPAEPPTPAEPQKEPASTPAQPSSEESGGQSSFASNLGLGGDNGMAKLSLPTASKRMAVILPVPAAKSAAAAANPPKMGIVRPLVFSEEEYAKSNNTPPAPKPKPALEPIVPKPTLEPIAPKATLEPIMPKPVLEPIAPKATLEPIVPKAKPEAKPAPAPAPAPAEAPADFALKLGEGLGLNGGIATLTPVADSKKPQVVLPMPAKYVAKNAERAAAAAAAAKAKTKAEKKAGGATPAATANQDAGAATAGGSSLTVGLLGSAAEPTHMQLTVEADFHIEDGKVGLRFYASTTEAGAYRHLLSMATIYNYNKSLPCNTIWSDSDKKIIETFAQLLKRWIKDKRQVGRLNSTVYPLAFNEFLSMRRRFAADIGRFVNRDDQKPLPPPDQSAPVGQAFQLSKEDVTDDKFRVHAQLIFPNGVRKYVHEVLAELSGDTNVQLTRAELFSTEMPVPWPRLVKYFSGRVTTINKDKVVELLPLLLNEHLELLENGPCVKRRNFKVEGAKSPEIHFSLVNGAFQIQCRFGERPVPLNANSINLIQKIQLDKDQLVISELKENEEISAAMNIIHELARNPNASTTKDGVVFANSIGCAMFLSKAWQAIPKSVDKSATSELRGIFGSKRENVDLLPLLDMEGEGNIVNFNVKWQDNTGGHRVAPAMLYSALRNHDTVVKDEKGQWLSIDPERAEEIRRQLQLQGILNEDGTNGRLLRCNARDSLKKFASSGCIGTGKIPYSDAEAETFAQRLLTEPVPELPQVPQSLATVLRDYQRTGVEFLVDRALYRVGAILADDMGLGKTLQVLSALETWRAAGLAKESAAGFSALVICPATVIGVWVEQARKFCPELPVVAMIGTAAKREQIFNDNPNAVLITHYGLLRSDIQMFQKRSYEFVVLDEAQNIKNPDAQVTVAVKTLDARHRLALTGTPIENRLTDLWSIMDFLNHGFFGELGDFTANYNANGNLAPLVRRLAPLMLRRDKSTVAAELPPRTVNVEPVEMTEEQQRLYDCELVKARNAVRSSGAFEIVTALIRLRQICCDPELMLKSEHDMGSGKLLLLLERLDELLTAGHSVLVFSQFTQMLDIIARKLQERKMPYRMITGDTQLEKRSQLVEEFNQDPQASVMLLSLKAASTGLTLTRADYVFLYDPWWNPAVENQAIDRTHRIGQTRPVFAYRLVAQGSVEERVLALMQEKQELFDVVVGGASAETVISRLDRNDLLKLLE